MKVYLAGPITGLTYDDATYWRKWFAKSLPGVEFLNPLRGKEHLAEPGEVLPDAFDAETDAVERDLDDIESADVVVVNFLHTKHVSIGTCCELGYAKALRKPVIVMLCTDSDPHNHLFVRTLATRIVTNMADALGVIRDIESRKQEAADLHHLATVVA